MPSRKIKEACPKCGFKNAARSKFCNQCAANLPQAPRPTLNDDKTQRQSEHRDIAHPITAECREMIQKKVLDAYESEKKKSTTERVSSRGSEEFDSSDVDVE
jgi:stage V sporulation protein G